MIRVPFAGIGVAAALLSSSTDSLAQARGPSAAEIQQAGQEMKSILDRSREEWEQDWGEAAKTRDRENMRRDDAASAQRLASMDAFLRRIAGRFRIDGKIEREVYFTASAPGGLADLLHQGQTVVIKTERVPVGVKVSGVADCKAIGDGAGINCLISASWPAFDRVNPPRYCVMHSPIPICRLTDADFTAGEQLDTMRPAVLALGLDRDPPQLRGMLVTADTLSNEWAGKLEGDKARFVQTEACTTLRCYAEMEITTASQGDDITLVLRQKLTWKVTLTLTLHRDPDARLDKELEPMRER